MALKTIQVSVSENAYGVGEALVGLVGSAKQALADGFQPGQDIPTIAAQNFASLVAAVGELKDVSAELGEDKAAFMRAWANVGADLAAKFF
jgi:hypothetical protein